MTQLRTKTMLGVATAAIAMTALSLGQIGAAEAMQYPTQITVDPLNIQPMLNVRVAERMEGASGGAVVFETWSNYPDYIARSELRVFRAGQVGTSPIAVLPVTDLRAQWISPPQDGGDYFYVLRVYDAKGRFDETAQKRLRLAEEGRAGGEEPVRAPDRLANWDATARRTIPVNGAAVTASAQDLPEGSLVQVFGETVTAGPEGNVVITRILPEGAAKVRMSIRTPEGERVFISKRKSIDTSDWFFVGIGEVTAGTNTDEEAAALLSGDSSVAGDNYVTGRGAFYAKGRTRSGIKVTASVDTTEDDLGNLFSNLGRKDPDALLRRLDAERSYPVYGDDSSLVEDAPTQGQIYVRVEKDEDMAVWGNFLTDLTDTEFAQIDRGLYGGLIDLRSDEVTSFGEREGQVAVFVADPGTLPARDEFLGTGGSLYFLKRQDVVIGSERLRIEVRDKVSGLVLQTRDLRAGVDYDIDYVQGRVLLSRPLNSITFDGEVVRDGPLSGNDVVLVSRYEFVPGLTDIAGYSTGGRAERWLGEHLRLGLTGQSEETGAADQTLLAGDMTLRLTEGTYLKGEVALTEGPGFGLRQSIDGGFTFADREVDGNAEAMAFRLEGAAELGEKARGTFYFEDIEEGFSAPGQVALSDTLRYGASLARGAGEQNTVRLALDAGEVDGRSEELALNLDASRQLTDRWSTRLGYRYTDRTVSAEALPSPVPRRGLASGERHDLAGELRHSFSQSQAVYVFGQTTLSRGGGIERRDRLGGGTEFATLGGFTLRSEVSGGVGGFGALAELARAWEDGTETYVNYALDSDRSIETPNTPSALNGGTVNTLTAGGRRRYSDVLSVYGEERATFGDAPSLLHAYGADLRLWDGFDLGVSTEFGTVELNGQTLDREAASVSAGYGGGGLTLGSVFEWREDESPLGLRRTWLVRNTVGLELSEDWRALGRYNRAESNDAQGDFFDGDFTEAQLAFAYRPVRNDRLNSLFRYTYFANLPTAQQASPTGQTGLPAQRSHILSVDGTLDLGDWISIGAKYGYRSGEVSLDRGSDALVESTAQLGVLRADLHWVKRWDVLVEARALEVDIAEDTRIGALAAIYRHVGDNVKIGVGYNFTKFSDDLTDLTYDDDGVFLNLIGKM